MTDRTPPGAAHDDALQSQLEEALKAKGDRYRPRTHHFAEDGGPRFNNRLLLERSPYLLQHAHNPVDWRPWGPEAFEEAKAKDKPVFLSVGYSTCHWCHVMERESFEDTEIAQVINEDFIPVKVDREERPDVDGIYMAAVQAISGGGGWPMSVFLTPDKEPFFAGTYFPARDGDRGPHRGLFSILHLLSEAWEEQRERVLHDAGVVAGAVREELSASPPSRSDAPPASILDDVVRACDERFDNIAGGLQVHTKFPSQLPVRLLLRRYTRTGDARALHMARFTLEKMHAGGMYDHVGGGFHRYSTDPKWLVPHFEKMLYDNALLTVAYLEGYQVTGEERFADVAAEILDYVAREMTHEGGAFFAATDADSLAPSGASEEGYYFSWTPGEIQAEVGSDGLALLSRVYGVTPAGNFEGRNVLHLPKGKIPDDVDKDELDALRLKLYAARGERPSPLRDDKILCAWNGLMISAFAQGGLVLDDDSYTARAKSAATFVLENLIQDDDLHRVWLDGDPAKTGLLDDHAFLCQGLLDLFEADPDPRWLDAARDLDEELLSGFEDESGGWFLTPHEHEELLVREKPRYDGAEPSGASVHVHNLLRLHTLTDDESYRQRAERALAAAADQLEHRALSLTDMLIALDVFHGPGPQLVLGGPGVRESELMDVARKTLVPGRALVAADDLSPLAEATPLAKDRAADEPTAWLCRGFVCDAPTTSADKLAAQLESKPEAIK
jgi:uncharacterized protein YyaL (SSP411 family)